MNTLSKAECIDQVRACMTVHRSEYPRATRATHFGIWCMLSPPLAVHSTPLKTVFNKIRLGHLIAETVDDAAQAIAFYVCKPQPRDMLAIPGMPNDGVVQIPGGFVLAQDVLAILEAYYFAIHWPKQFAAIVDGAVPHDTTRDTADVLSWIVRRAAVVPPGHLELAIRQIYSSFLLPLSRAALSDRKSRSGHYGCLRDFDEELRVSTGAGFPGFNDHMRTCSNIAIDAVLSTYTTDKTYSPLLVACIVFGVIQLMVTTDRAIIGVGTVSVFTPSTLCHNIIPPHSIMYTGECAYVRGADPEIIKISARTRATPETPVFVDALDVALAWFQANKCEHVVAALKAEDASKLAGGW